MGILSYDEYLNEEEKVKMDRELREYTLTHMKDDRFQLKSSDFFKEFSVLPYKGDLMGKFHKVHKDLADAIETLNVQELYSAVSQAESLPYTYGNVYTTKYTLSEVPELTTSLDSNQLQALGASEKEFLLNNFSQLGKSIKDEIIETLRERAEVLCSVVEALFYYVRTIDKENFYEGMDATEIAEEYQKQVEKSSKEASFSVKGPYTDPEGTSDFTSTSQKAFWSCEKDMKKFFIRGTTSPKDLYAEENVGGTKSLKLSIVIEGEDTPQKEYAYFNLEELTNKVKSFYNNILKNGK